MSYTINDAFQEALLESERPQNKFEKAKAVDIEDLTIENIQDLYDCEYDYRIGNLVRCDNCGGVFEEDMIGEDTRDVVYYADDWDYFADGYRERREEVEEDFEFCPLCEYGCDEDERFECSEFTLEDLLNDIDEPLNGLTDIVGEDFIIALRKYLEDK